MDYKDEGHERNLMPFLSGEGLIGIKQDILTYTNSSVILTCKILTYKILTYKILTCNVLIL
jgi:hypothetical protein